LTEVLQPPKRFVDAAGCYQAGHDPFADSRENGPLPGTQIGLCGFFPCCASDHSDCRPAITCDLDKEGARLLARFFSRALRGVDICTREALLAGTLY